MENKRYFSRIHFEGETKVKYRDEFFDAELHDLSLKGALISFTFEPPIKNGETCHVELTLPASDIVLSFECEAVHHHENYVGLQFFSLTTETLTHLRKIIELNLGDHEKTTEELAFWLK
ncbi:MAG: PilZ domain-containing protein [Fibrobacterales bacterium]